MDFEKELKIQQFKSEYTYRLRVFNDSQRICQTTKDVDVFKRRLQELKSFIEWCYKMKEDGLPIKINEDKSDSWSEFGNFVNFHCLRIAKAIKGNRQKILDLNVLLQPSPNFKEAITYFNKELGYGENQ